MDTAAGSTANRETNLMKYFRKTGLRALFFMFYNLCGAKNGNIPTCIKHKAGQPGEAIFGLNEKSCKVLLVFFRNFAAINEANPY